jgi:hypothetical protein
LLRNIYQGDETMSRSKPMTEKEKDARYNLYGAAGLLLEACQEMLKEMQVWEQEQGTHPAAEKARKAIALANKQRI